LCPIAFTLWRQNIGRWLGVNTLVDIWLRHGSGYCRPGHLPQIHQRRHLGKNYVDSSTPAGAAKPNKMGVPVRTTAVYIKTNTFQGVYVASPDKRAVFCAGGVRQV
jgi:hypothetical protein